MRSVPTRLWNAQAGLHVAPRTDLVLDAFNLLDAAANDIDHDYCCRSRLPGEPDEGVEDVHTTRRRPARSVSRYACAAD